jgi:hypothetical protein
MTQSIFNKIRILNKIIFIIVFYSIYSFCQLGSAGLPKDDFGGLMSEALHQAIGLEKLPEVNLLLDEDTIYVLVYGSNDSISNEVLSGFLPTHIDIWKIKSISSNDINLKDSNFYYLRMIFKKDGDKFIINLVCQPNNEDFIDRGLLRLEFKFEDGVIKLLSLSRGYG